MKTKNVIQIITVYRSKNFGSYLQAKSLYEQLKGKYRVEFLDLKTRKIIRLFILDSLKKLKKSGIKEIKSIKFDFIETCKLYFEWIKLPHTRNKKVNAIHILGSDEIWNISRKECRIKEYYGCIGAKEIIAYAPSINNSDIDDFYNHSEYLSFLKCINRISVRDETSRRVINKLMNNINVDVVLDPTLLKNPDKYGFECEHKYIAVYLFEHLLDDDDIYWIKDFAYKRNLIIVSCGIYLNWCDLSVNSKNCNPFYIYENAEYVITNTFHGTAFAINYRKNFISIVKKSEKIYNLLYEFGLDNRIINSCSQLKNVVNENIDYELVEKSLHEKRKKSLEFLYSSLHTVNN